MDIFEFLLFGFCSAPWIYRLMFHHTWDVFIHRFFKYVFTVSLSFPSGPSNINVRPFMIVPRASEPLVILLHLSFCCLDGIIPVDQLSSSLTLFLLCYLCSALEPIQWVFSLSLYFSDLRLPFDPSPYNLSFLRLSSLTFVVRVFAIFPIAV